MSINLHSTKFADVLPVGSIPLNSKVSPWIQPAVKVIESVGQFMNKASSSDQKARVYSEESFEQALRGIIEEQVEVQKIYEQQLNVKMCEDAVQTWNRQNEDPQHLEMHYERSVEAFFYPRIQDVKNIDLYQRSGKNYKLSSIEERRFQEVEKELTELSKKENIPLKALQLMCTKTLAAMPFQYLVSSLRKKHPTNPRFIRLKKEAVISHSFEPNQQNGLKLTIRAQYDAGLYRPDQAFVLLQSYDTEVVYQFEKNQEVQWPVMQTAILSVSESSAPVNTHE